MKSSTIATILVGGLTLIFLVFFGGVYILSRSFTYQAPEKVVDTTAPKTIIYHGQESIITSVGENGVTYVDTPSEIIYRDLLKQYDILLKAQQVVNIEFQTYLNILHKYMQAELPPPVNN